MEQPLGYLSLKIGLGSSVNIYKWIIIVGLNAVLGFLLGAKWHNLWFLVGIISGVISWLLFYIFLDQYLINTKRLQESKRLTLCASLRIPLQLTFYPDMYAGFAAIATIDFLGFKAINNPAVEGYLLTIFTGLYLSLICAIIYSFLYVVAWMKKANDNKS